MQYHISEIKLPFYMPRYLHKVVRFTLKNDNAEFLIILISIKSPIGILTNSSTRHGSVQCFDYISKLN